MYAIFSNINSYRIHMLYYFALYFSASHLPINFVENHMLFSGIDSGIREYYNLIVDK